MARVESGLRGRIRTAIRRTFPSALVIGQPANGMTGPGRHDLYVVVAGVYCGLEVKAIGHRTDARRLEIQTQRIRETRRAGGHAWFVSSVRAATIAVAWAEKDFRMPGDDFSLDNLLASLNVDPSIDSSADAKLTQDLASSKSVTNEQRSTAALPEAEELHELASQALIDALNNLSHEIVRLQQEINYLRAAIQMSKAPAPDDASEAEVSTLNGTSVPQSASADVMILLGLGSPSEETGPDEPQFPPPARRGRKRSSR